MVWADPAAVNAALESLRLLVPLLRLLVLTTEALFELSLTFNLTGGLRSSGSLESSCLILLLRGLLNLLLSTEIELEAVVAEFEPLAVGNLSNLTSHFLVAGCYRERENGIENIHPVGVKVGLKKGKKNNVHLQAESRES